MANELKMDYLAGQTLTARVRNAAGQAYHIASATFETYGAGGHAASSYDIAMTDKGNGTYRGTFPAALTTDGDYFVLFWDSTITDTPVGSQSVYVRNSVPLGLSDLILVVGAGGGDHTVTLTIRTTAGAVLAGVRVWLSADGDRENPATAAKVTNDAGVVTFLCDYSVLYYIHCHLSGYSFASASFTPAAGSVAFTKDIGTSATASGSASDYAESFLVKMIEQVRQWTGEPQINKKYSDAWIIERAENTYCLALGEKQRMEQDPIVARIPLTLDGSELYVLPGTIGPIQAVYYAGEYGSKIFYKRSGSYCIEGKGVWVEGNMLKFQDGMLAIGESATVEAWPTGLARLHCGTCTINAAGDEVTFGATPYLGTLDRQISAYLGSVLRIFNVTGASPTGNYVQERVISAYAVTTRVATLELAFSPIPAAGAGGYIFYEIAPAIPIGLDSIIGLRVAWEINSVEGQVKKAQGCLTSYQQNLRHLRLNTFCSQLQTAGQLDADTFQSVQGAGRLYG